MNFFVSIHLRSTIFHLFLIQLNDRLYILVALNAISFPSILIGLRCRINFSISLEVEDAFLRLFADYSQKFLQYLFRSFAEVGDKDIERLTWKDFNYVELFDFYENICKILMAFD